MNDNTKDTLDAIFEIVETKSVSPTTNDIVDVSPIQALQTIDAAQTPAPVEETHEEKIAKEDFEYSRTAIKSIVEDAQTALHRATDVATQTDSPRSFEVVAKLVQATVEAHRELQSIHKIAAETRLATKAISAPPPGSVNIQQGVVFSGTSEELLRMISKDRQ